MASYQPPTENLAIFDPLVFLTGDEALTYNEAIKKFLKYPDAQGEENLQAINVNGIATFNTSADFNGAVNCDSTAQFNGVSTFNNQILSNTSLSNTTPVMVLKETATNHSIDFIPKAGAGAYNPLVSAGDALIYSGPSGSSVPLTLTAHSSTNTGVHIGYTSTSIGAGGGLASPTTQVLCDGTNVVIKPNLKYTDNTIQASAYTGAGASAGSYTNTNLTLDSNGKITAISSGSSGGFALNSYTTSGNFTLTVPSTATKVKMWALGAGGGGGGGLWYGGSVPPSGYFIAGSSGGGGGGLSYIEMPISSTTIPSLYITVGTGGAGALGSATPLDGTAGGDTIIREVNGSGNYLIYASGGYGGKGAKLSNVYNSSANAGGNGGYGNLGTGGGGGSGGYFDGVSTAYNGGVGGRSSGIGASGGAGSGGCGYSVGGGNWTIYSLGGVGGGVPTAVGSSLNAGGGTAGTLGGSGGSPNATYKRETIGCASSGGCGWSNSAILIPNGTSPVGFWGAGAPGGGSYAFNPAPITFGGGIGGTGASGACWVQFE